MKCIKKLLIFIAFFSLSQAAFAQIVSDPSYIGLGLPMVSTKYGAAPGLAINSGDAVYYPVSKKLSVFFDLNYYLGSINFNYKTLDENGDFKKDASMGCVFYGARFSAGASYYIVPKVFYANLGATVSYNLVAALGSTEDFAGKLDPNDKNSTSFTAGDVAAGLNGLNYGLNITAGYIFDNYLHSKLCLRYDLGLNTFNANLPGYSSTIGQIMLCYHFAFVENSISRQYKNKLLK